MTGPLNATDAEALDAFCDGHLSAAEHAAFEARLAREPALRAEVERQRAIDAALKRAFIPPPPLELAALRGRAQVIPLRRTTLGRLWRPVAVAAALALIVGGGWWQWRKIISPPPEVVQQTIFDNYQAEVASGSKPAGECWNDMEFALVFFDKLAAAVVPQTPPSNVKLLGIDYSYTLSRWTVMLMAEVDGQTAIAYIDRIERDKGTPPLPAGCSKLHVFRRAFADLVAYEVTPLDQPHLLDLLVRTEMKPEWLDELKKRGRPY